jgi:iron(III) transport system ATP-binding protein
MPEISASGIVLNYGSHRAIDGIDFFIPHGSFTTLLGPSGCGKTTTLRMLAGFERPNEGSIRIGDQIVVDASRRSTFVPPQARQLGVVFQSYALWPHMTVYQQVAYPLIARRVPKATIRSRVEAALNTVKLPNLGAHLPAQLSGGQQQRVALARAIVIEPAVMLLDEPLSNLDAELRGEMRDELADIHRRLGITMVYVTHDQTEALALSDQVLVMRKGRIIERGNPRDIYNSPTTRYGAQFVGASNCIMANVVALNDSTGTVRLGSGRTLTVPFAAAKLPAGAAVGVAIKPEDVAIVTQTNAANTLSGKVAQLAYLGPRVELAVDCDGIVINASVAKEFRLEVGQQVTVQLRQEAIHLVPALDESAP